MGYTHYWTRPQIIEPTTFNAIAKDLIILLPTLEAAGVPLANAHGREEPEIGPEFIGFNGVRCCGHKQNLNIRLPWPKDDAHGVGSNEGLGGYLRIGPATAIVPMSRCGSSAALTRMTVMTEWVAFARRVSVPTISPSRPSW